LALTRNCPRHHTPTRQVHEITELDETRPRSCLAEWRQRHPPLAGIP
jgi:hypothetical protein